MQSNKSKTAEIRAKLTHPVIDSDGHLSEYLPVLREYLAAAGGKNIMQGFGRAFGKTFLSTEWYGLTPAERRELRSKRPPFWGVPTKNTLDLATSLFPRLLNERLDEIGLDFAVLYPGLGIGAQVFEDDEVRRATCRALNNYYADMFSEFPDRMTPVAVIPMHTPAEAIEELEYAVGKRGLKVVMLPSHIRRPV